MPTWVITRCSSLKYHSWLITVINTLIFQQGTTTAGNSNSTSNTNDEVGGTFGFDLINALVGFDNAESRMTELVAQINYFLTGKLIRQVEISG